MYKDLISYLAFTYGFICKGRGKIKSGVLQRITDGAHAVVSAAAPVLGNEQEQEEDRKDLQLACKMDQQIEEATVFLLSLENTL
jgi:hypothetical protein